MNQSIFPTDQLSEAPVVASVPSATWQMLARQVRTEPLPKNIDALFDTSKGYLGRLKYRTGRYLARAAQALYHEKL